MINNSITVGIPFCNKSNLEYLRSSVNSIINQTIKIDCIHLIKDGPISNDLEELIQKYSNEHENIIILSCPKKGLPYALNQSIKICNTEYYARMDSDDIAFPNRIDRQIDYLIKNPEIEILGAWSKEFEDESNLEDGFVNKRPCDYSEIKKYFHYRSGFIHPTVVFRLTLFDKIGYYNESFFTAQDIELCARALKNNIKIYNLQEPLLYYRIKGVQTRRSNFNAIKKQIKAKYSYNTLSLKINLLKIASILFRFLPAYVRRLAYKKIRY